MRDRSTRFILPGLLLLGALARTAHYLADRSLWLDEAMLALNLARRSFGGLVGTLDFNQAAPLGFLWLEKLSVLASGLDELALRLWPYAAGLAALFVFAALARRILDPLPSLFATACFALSGSLVYYAAEVKQYSFDALLAAVLLLLAMEIHGSARRWWALGLAGALGVWFSHPLVFVLPGVALYLWLGRGSRPAGVESAPGTSRLRPLVFVSLAWAASFTAAYLLTARDVAWGPLMARFWEEGFMPVPPTTMAELRWYAEALGELVRNAFDFSETRGPIRTLGVWSGGALALAGAVHAVRRRPRVSLLVGLPILLALLASALSLYPFRGRLLLFLVPSTLVLMGWGVEAGLRARDREPGTPARRGWAGTAAAAAAGVAFLLAASIVLAGWLRTPGREEIRPVLRHVAERARAGDVVYLHSGAQHAYLYYELSCAECRIDAATVVRGAFLAGGDEAIEAEIAALPVDRPVWLVFAHSWWGYGDIERERLVEGLSTRLGPPERFEAPGARAYRFEPASP